MKKLDDDFEINCDTCEVLCRGKKGLLNRKRTHKVMEDCQKPELKYAICSFQSIYKQNVVKHGENCGKKESS